MLVTVIPNSQSCIFVSVNLKLIYCWFNPHKWWILNDQIANFEWSLNSPVSSGSKNGNLSESRGISKSWLFPISCWFYLFERLNLNWSFCCCCSCCCGYCCCCCCYCCYCCCSCSCSCLFVFVVLVVLVVVVVVVAVVVVVVVKTLFYSKFNRLNQNNGQCLYSSWSFDWKYHTRWTVKGNFIKKFHGNALHFWKMEFSDQKILQFSTFYKNLNFCSLKPWRGCSAISLFRTYPLEYHEVTAHAKFFIFFSRCPFLVKDFRNIHLTSKFTLQIR